MKTTASLACNSQLHRFGESVRSIQAKGVDDVAMSVFNLLSAMFEVQKEKSGESPISLLAASCSNR